MKTKHKKGLYIEDGCDLSVRKMLREDSKELYNCKEFESISLTQGNRKTICQRVRDAVEKADIIYFDYGGLSVGLGFGGGKYIDYWDRFFIKLIENNPNKKWFCRSALQTFDDKEKEYLEKLGVDFLW